MKQGQKEPFTREQVALIRATLTASKQWRDLALLSLGIDTMLRASDLVALHVTDVIDVDRQFVDQAFVYQQKTGKRVDVAFTLATQDAVKRWLNDSKITMGWLFPGRHLGTHLSTKRYRALVKKWARIAKMDPTKVSTHSIRRTKASIIYRETNNPELVRILLGHSSIASTSAYLNIKGSEAVAISRGIEI